MMTIRNKGDHGDDVDDDDDHGDDDACVHKNNNEIEYMEAR